MISSLPGGIYECYKSIVFAGLFFVTKCEFRQRNLSSSIDNSSKLFSGPADNLFKILELLNYNFFYL